MTVLLFTPFLLVAAFVAFVLIVIVIALMQHRREKARTAAIRELARENGWTYIAKDARERPVRYRDFHPFGQGHSRYAHNITAGRRDGAPFEVFDYHFAETRSDGKDRRTTHYHYKVATIGMPIPGPGLSIERERLHHKILDKLGGGDIDFESDEFSRRFWVRSPNRRFAYDVIHTGMMEFLLEHPDWHWQWRGETLVLHGPGRLTPADVPTLLSLAARFRSLLPRHLLADRAAAMPWNPV